MTSELGKRVLASFPVLPFDDELLLRGFDLQVFWYKGIVVGHPSPGIESHVGLEEAAAVPPPETDVHSIARLQAFQ